MGTMTRLVSIIVLPIMVYSFHVQAQEAATDKWEQSYLQCNMDCDKDFPFTEHTDKAFAGIREACMQGCGLVPGDTVPGYRRCYLQCKKSFKYRHGMREEFSDFQRVCVEGCRNISQ